MTKKNIKNSTPLTCRRGWREKYCPRDRDGVEEIYAGDEILECSIKPAAERRVSLGDYIVGLPKTEEASDNNPSVSTSEYHLECFDNGYTIAEEEAKVCAVGDDNTKKHLGEFIFADIIHHCNLTCSNKVKITVKIESED